MIAFIPVWVYALLATLVSVGLLQARARLVSHRVVRSVSVVLALVSLWGVVAAFGAQVQAVLPWALGLGLAWWVGPWAFKPRGLAFDAASGRVQVPGSWLPMVVMLGIFGIKFGLGMAAGLGRPVLAGSTAAAAVALALGLLSGAFVVRARAIVAAAQGRPRQAVGAPSPEASAAGAAGGTAFGGARMR